MSFFGNASEKLSFVLQLDDRGAVRAFGQVRASAERDLGAADDRLNRIGGRMQVAGAAAVGFAGIAGRALFGFAQAAEEAEGYSRRLDQALANNADTAGAAKGPYEDLAASLQDLTGVDGDAVVGLEALLIGFGKTRAEVETLTPLVVDFATRYGLGLDQAGTLVNRALDGNTTRMERYIGQMREGETVTEALARTVGGFAERDAKSFNGQMRIMKENLGDVAEGIGVGVIDAFSSAVGVVDGLTSAFGALGPETQAGIGRVATYGVGLIGLAGAGNLVVGTLIKLRENIKSVSSAAGGLQGFKSLGVGAAVVGGIVGGAVALKSLNDAIDDVQDAMEGLDRLNTRQLVDRFNLIAETGEHFGDAGADLEFFRQIAEDNIGTAQRLRDELARQGEDVTALDSALGNEAEAQRQANADAEVGTEVTDELAGANEDAADAVSDHVKAIHDLSDALSEAHDEMVAQTDLVAAYEGAIDDLTDGIVEHGDSLNLDTEAGRANYDQGRQTADAIVALMQARYEETGSLNEAIAAGDQYVQRLRDQLSQAGLTEGAIDEYIATLGLVPADIVTNIRANTAEAVRALQDVQRLAAGVTAGSYEINYAVRQPGARAAGGPVRAGVPYIVGEQGPEVIVPAGNGTVIPNGRVGTAAAAAGAVPPIVVNFNGLITNDMAKAIIAELADAKRRGYLMPWDN